jgi:hypothetical protein
MEYPWNPKSTPFWPFVGIRCHLKRNLVPRWSLLAQPGHINTVNRRAGRYVACAIGRPLKLLLAKLKSTNTYRVEGAVQNNICFTGEGGQNYQYGPLQISMINCGGHHVYKLPTTLQCPDGPSQTYCTTI